MTGEIIENKIVISNKGSNVTKDTKDASKCPKCAQYFLVDQDGCNKITCPSIFCQGKTLLCKQCFKLLADEKDVVSHFPKGLYYQCVNEK
jgi:hypothetical protein